MGECVTTSGLIHDQRGRARPLRVLHVTECFGAGVGRAIGLRAAALPEAEHHLLWTGAETPAASRWASMMRLPRTLPSRISAARRRTRELGVDVVHAHSSWAGVYTRVVSLDAPVVYEPHCFKFTDPALRGPVSRTYRFIERCLTMNTVAVGVLSPDERAIVAGMSRRLPAIEIPNVPTLSQPDVVDGPWRPSRLVMVGRLAPQKDPGYFAEVVAQLRRGGFTGDAVWVGDGDLGLRRMLTAAGVRVTGWLGPADLEAMLRESIYIHSARYEGFPLSILDAAVCGAPIVARRISALERTGLLMASAAHDVADLVARLLRSPEAVDRCRLRGEALLASHLPEQLARALATLYTKALSEESE